MMSCRTADWSEAMKKSFLIMLLTAWPAIVSAQAVAWDCMQFDVPLSTERGVEYQLWLKDPPLYSSGFFAYTIFYVSDYGSNFVITTHDLEDTLSGFIGNWLVANAGDEVSETTTRHKGNYLNHAKIDGETGYSIYNLEGVAPKDYYLAFAVENLDDYNNNVVDPRYAYGWAHIAVNEDMSLSLLGSAMSLDGSSLIVGAIPEPSAWVLLVLGLSALALRRRPKPPALVQLTRLCHAG